MCSIKPRSRKMYHCDHSRQTRIVSAHNLQVEMLIIVEIQIVIKFMFSTLDNIIKLTDLLSHDLLCPYPKSRKYQRKEDKTCKNEKNFSLLICAYFAIFELICLLEKHEVTRFRTDLQKKNLQEAKFVQKSNKQANWNVKHVDRQAEWQHLLLSSLPRRENLHAHLGGPPPLHIAAVPLASCKAAGLWVFGVWMIQTIDHCIAITTIAESARWPLPGSNICFTVCLSQSSSYTHHTHTYTVSPANTSSGQTNPFQIWACSRHAGGKAGWLSVSEAQFACVCVGLGVFTWLTMCVWIPGCSRKPYHKSHKILKEFFEPFIFISSYVNAIGGTCLFWN